MDRMHRRDATGGRLGAPEGNSLSGRRARHSLNRVRRGRQRNAPGDRTYAPAHGSRGEESDAARLHSDRRRGRPRRPLQSSKRRGLFAVVLVHRMRGGDRTKLRVGELFDRARLRRRPGRRRLRLSERTRISNRSLGGPPHNACEDTPHGIYQPFARNRRASASPSGG